MNFYEKVADVQARLKAPKSQYNSFGKYNYRNLEDILEAVKPLLSEHGLVMTIADEIQQVGERVYVRATATITDGENKVENTAYAREPLTKKGMDDSQLTGSCSSYSRKYCCQGLLLLDDSNSDADSQEPVSIEDQVSNCQSVKALTCLYQTLNTSQQIEFKELFSTKKNQMEKNQ